MSVHTLDVETAILTDAAQARDSLQRMLVGSPHEFHLRLPLDDFAVPGDLTVEKAVLVKAAIARDESNVNDVIRVTFEGESSAGLFPKFSGIVDVYPDDVGSILQLCGSYDSPFGIAGEMFDATIGHLIAQRSAKAFLDELGGKIAREAAAGAQ